ncbi:MAG TPA: ROK family protein, partial [bacterium]|nr:ROK family protein [bacterium]
ERGWDLHDLSRHAGQGDAFSLKLYREIGYWLGIATSSLVNIFAPEAVYFSGGVSGGYRYFLPEMKKTVRERAFSNFISRLRFGKAHLNSFSGARGALLLASE